MKKQYISQKGLDDLKNELKELKSSERKKVLAQLTQAKSYGDLSENVEYSEMKDRKRQLDARVRKLEDIIKNAVVTDDHCDASGEVVVGCVVHFKAVPSNENNKYQIVGVAEADPLKGKISNESPIGKAFLGKKVGDEVKAETPAGTQRYKIVKIG